MTVILKKSALGEKEIVNAKDLNSTCA